MPTYQYACTVADCGHEFERVQSFSDDALTECPVCAGRLRKVWGSIGVVFKGSGFYRNDSRAAGSNGDKAKSESGSAKSEAKSDSGSKAKSESGSGDSGAAKSGSGTAKKDSSPSTPSTGSGSSGSGSSGSSSSGAKSSAASGPSKS